MLQCQHLGGSPIECLVRPHRRAAACGAEPMDQRDPRLCPMQRPDRHVGTFGGSDVGHPPRSPAAPGLARRSQQPHANKEHARRTRHLHL